MKKIANLLLLASLSFAQVNVSFIVGQTPKVEKSITYKGTKNYLRSDFDIEKFDEVGLKISVKKENFPGFFIDYYYFNSSTQLNVLKRNIIIDDLTYSAGDSVKTRIYMHHINAGVFYRMKADTNIFDIGFGFYTVLGNFYIRDANQYTNLDFDFYYPSLFLKYNKSFSRFNVGGSFFRSIRDDNVYNLNLYVGCEFQNKWFFNIGYNRIRMNIDDYDEWSSKITASGIFAQIGKKF